MQFSSRAIIIILITLTPLATHGQTLQFNMEVQPELSVEVLQDLNFGTVVTNSGITQVELGNPQMGIFKIRALRTQSALLTLQKPDRLTKTENQDTTNTIPLNLDAAYAPEAGNYRDYLPFANDRLRVTLSDDNENPSNGNGDQQVWDTGYVFIFGTIDVRDISLGSYSGTLVLNVVYQ